MNLRYVSVRYFDTNLRPVIARHFPDGGYLFQDDNALVHQSRITCTQEYITRSKQNKKHELACTDSGDKHDW